MQNIFMPHMKYVTAVVQSVGMANGSRKNVGLRKFRQDLEIFKAFLRSLALSSLHVLFLPLFESRNFLPRSLGLSFLTRILASQRVSDFTIRHPYQWYSSMQSQPHFKITERKDVLSH